MTPKELSDNLKAELDRALASLQSVHAMVERIEAVCTPSVPVPVDDHWLAFPSQYRPIKITQEFGGMCTVGGVTWQHEGMDISVPTGTPVYASAGGQVVIAGVRAGYGNCVRIQHVRDGERWWTWYGHLSMMFWQVGNIVDAGQGIALSGNTGNTTGPHLHLTIQREDDKILPQGCSEILRGCVNPRLFVQWPT